MQLQNEQNIISIKGNIATVSEFDDIKQNLELMRTQHKNVVLKIYDSLVINSSLIGYLVKVVNQDGVNIHLHAGNEILYELLDDLGLSKTLNLKKI